MIIETSNLIDYIKKGTTELDLSDETKYHKLLTNTVILGYIFLLNLNKKLNSNISMYSIHSQRKLFK